ncbi:MAG: acetate/propionate family kinase [Pseudomonadota bacterium]
MSSGADREGSMILTLNAGSSSIKFSVYRSTEGEPDCRAVGQVENLGPAARLQIKTGSERETHEIGAADHGVALRAILRAAAPVFAGSDVAAVGHRIAHGGVDFTEPRTLDPDTLAALTALEPLAPLHQPHNLAAVHAAQAAFPDALQFGCFDTSFHRGHPWVNDTFALPRQFYEAGVRRYGFHGLSYEYVTGHLADTAPELAAGRVVICHLGNGASMCAVRAGKSVASTMGFSALDGLPMGTRCGQLDPGVLLYLMDQRRMSAAEITALLYKESGLKGLSGISHDMRTLEGSDAPEAAQAIDYFVFRIRREIGAMVATLRGIDALVFCGGIGENSATIRARICTDMAWLGIEIDPSLNARNADSIAATATATAVRVVRTDEERVIARAAACALAAE